LDGSTHIRIAVYNALGQLVKVIADNVFDAGRNEILWDLRDDQGQKIAQGVYFYEITHEVGTMTGKILLIE
jgi:flagellar hook assembly protein FlgD